MFAYESLPTHGSSIGSITEAFSPHKHAYYAWFRVGSESDRELTDKIALAPFTDPIRYWIAVVTSRDTAGRSAANPCSPARAIVLDATRSEDRPRPRARPR